MGILDWGLGHACRMIPVIHHLLQFQCQVLIAATGPQKKLLEAEFPGLTFLTPPEYAVKYNNRTGALVFGLFRQLPRLIRVIRQEEQWVRKIVREYQVSGIISDNRYGFRHPSVYSVVLCHQIAPKTGLGQRIDNIVKFFHIKKLSRFRACWIPDEKAPGLAGQLSHPGGLPSHFTYIGPLSRFAGQETFSTNKEGLLILLSGPEPHRTRMEQSLLQQVKEFKGKYTFIRGLPGESKSILGCINHVPANALLELIRNADQIICGAGYTTVMDLVALKKTAVLVPTPGQTEQEYLARYLTSAGLFLSTSASALNLEQELQRLHTFTPNSVNTDFFQFRKTVEAFLARLNHPS